MTFNLVCIGCRRGPTDIPEYFPDECEIDDVVEWITEENDTYNPANGHFACTACYVQMGMPTTPQGWKAP